MARASSEGGSLRPVAMLGNPNVGKTTLFNALCGLRQKAANFPGTTQEAHVGAADGLRLVDLPGAYTLGGSSSESEVCRSVIEGRLAPLGMDPAEPETLLVVADATNLLRNLVFVGEVLALGRPTAVAVNLIDMAKRRGVHVDRERLEERLGCPVVLCNARGGECVGEVRAAVSRARVASVLPPAEIGARERWAEEVYADVASARGEANHDSLTDRLDRAFTHPVLGVIWFIAVMTGLFWVIFRLAAYPMDWIDAVFTHLGGLVESAMPAGVLRDLLANGVIAGVGATVVFVPQIFLLFLLISLLEGTGYLARAAFVVDRLLRPFGLSGHAFVPLLSSHACALPGIMAARAVPDRRDRLATILAAPFMSCTARIPVYVLLTTLLFPESPAMQAVAFTSCYVIGVVAGLLSALVARRTILRGRSRPMALELPSYRVPDVRTALMTAWDRGLVFLRKAGTLILGFSVVLWWLGSYPLVDPPAEAVALRTQGELNADEGEVAALLEEADRLEASHAAEHSFLGQIGSFVQPVFAPLGYDRQLTVGVLASFAAREVFVSTMAVQVVGRDDTGDEGVFEALASAERDNGRPIFDRATSWSLLVYYVLAMQCIPTLVVTAREAGGAKWAFLQLAWMSGLAYVCAMVVYQVMR